MVIFKTGSIFLCHIPCDPIPSQTSVHRLTNTRNITTCYCSTQVSNATSIFPLHVNFQGESLNSKMDATQGWVMLGLCLDHEMTKLNYSQRLRKLYLRGDKFSIFNIRCWLQNNQASQNFCLTHAIYFTFRLNSYIEQYFVPSCWKTFWQYLFYKIATKSRKMNFSSGASQPNCNFFQNSSSKLKPDAG